MPTSTSLTVEDLRLRLKWLLFVRVVLVTFLFGVTILVSLPGGDTELISSFTALYLLIGYAYLLTAVSAALLRSVRRLVLFGYLQIVGDVVFITGILKITGGMESPFVFLYFLCIISGSVLGYQQGSVFAALVSGLSYMLLFYFETAGWPGGAPPARAWAPVSGSYYRVFLNLFSFFGIAFLSYELARRLKKAGEEIRRREDRFQDLRALHENIVQSVTSGLITTDLDGRVTSANRSSEKILGRSRGDLMRRRLDELFPFEPVRRYLARGGESDLPRFEISLRDERGGERVLGMSLTALRSRRGERTGHLCTFQDLTPFKAMEEKARRNEQLAAIGELAAGIAHEIRNPLASMSGSIQVLRSELPMDAESRRLMEIVLKETERLNRLVGNFLAYARPVPVERRPVAVDELLEETATLLAHSRHRGEGVRIETECPAGLTVAADPTGLRQVLWNLAVNGLEAMGGEGRLLLQAERAAGEEAGRGGDPQGALCRIRVSDTGPGIDAATREKLFFPFHTTKPRGTGLGLAIVHQVVRQHGGWIDVTSAPGRGTTFDVYLPAAAPAAAAREA